MSNNKSDEDDKSTVVLNLDELKKQSSMDSTGVSQILEFSAAKKAAELNAAELNGDPDLSLDDSIDLTEEERASCVLFDLGGNFFSSNLPVFNEVANAQVVSDLKALNGLISKDKSGIFIFYFNNAGKQINALLAQINKKFPTLKTVLIANNLSSDKAKAHAKTASAAKHYLSWPADSAAIKKILESC